MPDDMPVANGSVGLVEFPRDGRTAADLIRAADLDMHARKRGSARA